MNSILVKQITVWINPIGDSFAEVDTVGMEGVLREQMLVGLVEAEINTSSVVYKIYNLTDTLFNEVHENKVFVAHESAEENV